MAFGPVELNVVNDCNKEYPIELYYFKLESSTVDVLMAKKGFDLLIKAMGFSVISDIKVDKLYDIEDDYEYTIVEAYIVKRPSVGYKVYVKTL